MKEEELRCIFELEKENSELIKKVKIGIKRLLNQNEQKDKEIEQLNKEKSILEKALRLVLQYDIGVIDYDELDKANKMVEEYNKELKEEKNNE